MTHRLKNNSLDVLIDLPSENNKGSRFDWTGRIKSISFLNTPLTTLENPALEEDPHMGKGLYNEFGIDTPLGFDETEIGGWFHKIGIGLLKKDDHQYNFQKKYTIKPAKFDIVKDSHKIVICCTSEMMNGYAYFLKKEIALHASELTIQYTLENTGKNDLVTDEYTHNFMGQNKVLLGKNYELAFPFKLKPTLFEETVNPELKVDIGVHKVTFNDTPTVPYFFSNLTGNGFETASWKLINLDATIGIQEMGNFKTDKVNLWGSKHVISPELFFKIFLKPKESIEWSRRYEVFKINS